MKKLWKEYGAVVIVIIIIFFMAWASVYGATVTMLPMPKQEARNSLGTGACSGCLLYTYEPGTTTLKNTYTDSTGNVANLNPVQFDTAGRASVWGDGCYKLILRSAAGALISSQDNICEYSTASPTFSQWQDSGLTPTYIGATSFSFAGDQTTLYEPGLRLKTVNTGGTVYSTIVSSSYGSSITTITVANDSGTLDSGISDVDYSILTVSNPARPVVPVSTKTGGYTILPTDCGKTIISNITSAATFTLPAANAVPSGCDIVTKNTATYTLTLGGTVDGTSNPTITAQYDSMTIFSNGSTWQERRVKNATAATTATSLSTIPGLMTSETYSVQSAGGTPSIDLGTVTNGDRIFVSACTICQLTATATDYCSIKVSKSSGTATIAFIAPGSSVTTLGNFVTGSATTAWPGAADTGAACVSDVLNITGTGTLTLQAVPGMSGGAISSVSVKALFFKKQ